MELMCQDLREAGIEEGAVFIERMKTSGKGKSSNRSPHEENEDFSEAGIEREKSS